MASHFARPSGLGPDAGHYLRRNGRAQRIEEAVFSPTFDYVVLCIDGVRLTPLRIFELRPTKDVDLGVVWEIV
jgi:hypothetical protein